MKIVEISAEEWEGVRRYKAIRDECSMKMGVIEYESSLLKARYIQRIERSLREEAHLAQQIAERYGIDVSLSYSFQDGAIHVSD